MMECDTEILTVMKAARRCGVARVTVWRWIKSGRLPSAQTAGGHHRILQSELVSFMCKNKMTNRMRGENSNTRILIVDDEPVVLKLYNRTFSEAGYRTATASNGFEAGLTIMKFKPQLILLDLYMPQMNGFEVCRRLKADEETAGIKIIAFSGRAEDEGINHIYRCGADLFLTKPLGRRVVLEHVARLLGAEQTGGIPHAVGES